MNEALLIVKRVMLDGGFEMWPVRAVRFDPAHPDGDCFPACDRDRVLMEGGESFLSMPVLDSGTVYIMNAAGKTIDTINLDGPLAERMRDDLRAQKTKREYDRAQAIGA